MYTKTEGIVLREVELGEADKLIDIMTREQGVLTARAKGVRRAKSPLKSACQLLTYSEFTLFEYRGKHTVQEAEPIEQFRPLRDDIELLALGSYFAQASAMISQADAPNPELLSLLLNALYALGMLLSCGLPASPASRRRSPPAPNAARKRRIGSTCPRGP